MIGVRFVAAFLVTDAKFLRLTSQVSFIGFLAGDRESSVNWLAMM
jgi:hypothetical protein